MWNSQHEKQSQEVPYKLCSHTGYMDFRQCLACHERHSQQFTYGQNADLNYLNKETTTEIRIPLTTPGNDTNLQEVYSMDGQTLLTGEKKDEGKPRWELIAYDAMGGIAQVLTMGASKYAARNWEKGIAYGRVFGAIMRHLTAWWSGNSTDSESGLSHLDHAMCELMFLSAYEKRGMAQLDDRPKGERK